MHQLKICTAHDAVCLLVRELTDRDSMRKVLEILLDTFEKTPRAKTFSSVVPKQGFELN
jgi:hypothetical protein